MINDEQDVLDCGVPRFDGLPLTCHLGNTFFVPHTTLDPVARNLTTLSPSHTHLLLKPRAQGSAAAAAAAATPSSVSGSQQKAAHTSHTAPQNEGDAAGSTSQLSFKRTRPLFVQKASPGGEALLLVRPLGLTGATLSAPTLPVGPASAASKAQKPQPELCDIQLRDVAAAMSHDPMLSKHPITWKIHNKLMMQQADSSGTKAS